VIYGLHMEMAFRNTARRDAVVSNVQNEVSGFNLYEPAQVGPTSLRGTTDPAMVANVMFVQKADRDQTWSDVLAFMGSGTNGPAVRSLAYIYDSDQDAGLNHNVVLDERRW
jgi:hypothetical protein